MTQAEEKPFVSLHVGDSVSFKRTISDDDVRAFAEVSGDHNPLHMDDAYARTTSFGSRIVHGMFLGALVSRLVGMQLPGKRALLMKESLEFKKPVRIGDTVNVSGRLASKSDATRLIEIELSVSSGDDLVASGSAHVRVLE